jgi:hypothetical protein
MHMDSPLLLMHDSRLALDGRPGTKSRFLLKIRCRGMSRTPCLLRLPYERAATIAKMTKTERSTKDMKYILLMSGTKAGVDTYVAWSRKDIDAHMAVLKGINRELTESGEFVGTEGLAGPDQAIVVRGQRAGMPITDGIFPEAKEFLLGYWIVDVKTPERANEIAARISVAPGPDGGPTNMPIEVRQIVRHSAKS